ncbi:hypothetical protein HDU91_007520 [Kappamyces sp. JEL0680]|nr:hypothetical protein HDU91_007520 [Kappamyces sp. JEL0680]
MDASAKRRSTREKAKLIYNADGTVVDEFKWTKMLSSKTSFRPYTNTLPGEAVSIEYFQQHGFTRPILIEEPTGLDMEIPSVSVRQVAQLVGSERIVEVLEVSTQTDRQMKLGEWADYFELPVQERERILNVISLEIGETALGKMVRRPKVVRDLDWIDNVWPSDVRIKEYPQVQLYCLMGVQDCYTEYGNGADCSFHIDFGGTSVFYHIISGEKIFYFIEPTKKNLETYASWSTSPHQSTTFLGDLVPVCYKLHLVAGNTMLIPSGWVGWLSPTARFTRSTPRWTRWSSEAISSTALRSSRSCTWPRWKKIPTFR